jgi:hypothetical protein
VDSRTEELKRKFLAEPTDELASQLGMALKRLYPDEVNENATFEVFNNRDGSVNFRSYNRDEGRRPNYIFVDVLRFEKIAKNGSRAARFILFSPRDNVRYEVYARKAADIIFSMQRGWIVGKWTFMRRGVYYALELIEEIK